MFVWFDVLGLKITGSAKDKHLAGIKCSLLVDQKINYQECFLLNLANVNGMMRDPSLLWSVECPANSAVVGLYDKNEFKTLEYAKCCKIQGK